MALDPNLTDADKRRIVLAQILTKRPGMPPHFAREFDGVIERGGDRRSIDALIARMKEDEEIRAADAGKPQAEKLPLDGRYRLRIGGITRNYRIKTSPQTLMPGVYDDESGARIYYRPESDAVLSHLSVPEERVAGLIAYGHHLHICGRCGRTLTTKTSIERGLGDECAEAVAWALGQKGDGSPVAPRYLVTFDRVGRSSQGVPEPVKLRAIDGDHLAEQLEPIILPRMRSMNVEIIVDLEAGRGQILAGFNNGGSFTITEIPAATTEPGPTP